MIIQSICSIITIGYVSCAAHCRLYPESAISRRHPFSLLENFDTLLESCQAISQILSLHSGRLRLRSCHINLLVSASCHDSWREDVLKTVDQMTSDDLLFDIVDESLARNLEMMLASRIDE